MEPEIRKLPKKTIVYMVIIGILGVVWLFLVSYGQSNKATKILTTLGYKNVSNVKVYAYHEFLREDTNTKGYKYTVSFINKDKNEECKGFVLKDFKRNVDQDLNCKKIVK
jgi:hypothetical protein